LRKTLAGTGCGVREVHTQGNKNKRILDGFEPPLSGRFLWAHTRVLDVVESQMRDWRADVSDQPDDFLDSGAEAIKQTPVRIGRIIGRVTELQHQDWRAAGPVHEVELDYAIGR
jgi:hypothetical protein